MTIDSHQDDATRLDELKLEPGYTLIFDFGCYHGLNRKHRDAYARGVNSVAPPATTLLMMGAPARHPIRLTLSGAHASSGAVRRVL